MINRKDSDMLHSLEKRLAKIEQQTHYIIFTLQQLNNILDEYIQNHEESTQHPHHITLNTHHPPIETVNNSNVEKPEKKPPEINTERPTPLTPEKTSMRIQPKKPRTTVKAKPRRKTNQKMNKVHNHVVHDDDEIGQALTIHLTKHQLDKKHVVVRGLRKKHLTLYWIQDCSPPCCTTTIMT
ncbi:hypothetical protein C9374_001381 [Naegleria lovaniensis]|uniref:Uncharacterized protein n=1 Tax=Naegleria lovaniensis TaxID=51637 RepID=A0AA88GRZ4_NAELO|nr:uncharacterized protein C9374_013123 [Naegleria lovaniensis]XP_044551779.1 uncharacterized protein C9374_001381 [Naegleria lovaniensis]KAG2372843.1 hypothetical protein C9374_013123 [Naegleria lovaniensis]KAG2387787.1 hypothetical protein C9374_001381 [Naegleria lovaniensis]